MLLHRTRSGRAWACRAGGPIAMALPRPTLAPQGPPVSQPLHDGPRVKEEEQEQEQEQEEEEDAEAEDGSVCSFVKDLRTRRVFTPSSLPVECSPDWDAKAAAVAGSPGLVDAADRGAMAKAVAGAAACSPPNAVKVMDGASEKTVGVLDRGAKVGEEGEFQSTPPDIHLISKSEATMDGSDVASQRSGGGAEEGRREKQKNWSDQSHSRLETVLCSRMRLVRDPKSFSYRRLLPFLMDLTRSSSNSLEALPYQSHPIKIEKPMLERSIQPLSSSPAQAKVVMPEKMRKDLDPIGQAKETVIGLEHPGNDAYICLSGNSKDNIRDTAVKSSCSYTEGAKLSCSFNAHEMEMICKSSSNIPDSTEALSFEELVGGKQGPSNLPGQPKADSVMILNGCTKLSAQTSRFGAACPLGANHSPCMKGILKRCRGGCIGLCTCLDCASFRLHAERAFEFSRKQMQEAEDVAMGLINELSYLRKLVENHCAIATCVTRNDVHQHGQLKGVCRRASRAEDIARKHLKEMNDDLNFHCRNIRPRVSFSECTEERIISEIDNSNIE